MHVTCRPALVQDEIAAPSRSLLFSGPLSPCHGHRSPAAAFSMIRRHRTGLTRPGISRAPRGRGRDAADGSDSEAACHGAARELPGPYRVLAGRRQEGPRPISFKDRKKYKTKHWKQLSGHSFSSSDRNLRRRRLPTRSPRQLPADGEVSSDRCGPAFARPGERGYGLIDVAFGPTAYPRTM